ncbi:hypothetical protein Taro_056725, partial [Colocasia esculenta]|nr:hypothetical protein [Colocasia esculenta]
MPEIVFLPKLHSLVLVSSAGSLAFEREFDSVILQRNPHLTDVQVEKEREKSFATWLRYRWEVVHLIQCTLYFCRPRVYADRVRLPDYSGHPHD